MRGTLSLLAIALPLAACERPSVQPANVTTPVREAERAAPPPEPTRAETNATAAVEDTPAPAEETAIASTTIPDRFLGAYDRDEASCRARSSVWRLRIGARELRFHESLGEVKSVSADGTDAIRVASDYSGEGMEWSTSQRLVLADDGARLTVTGEGAPFTRVRC